MKQDTITYSVQYGDSLIQPYFSSFLNDLGERILQRKVVAYCDKWQRNNGSYGNALVFEIWESYVVDCIKRDRKLQPTTCIFDIETSKEQSFLIGILAEGEIRGRYAELVIQSLYVDLFVLAEGSPMQQYLPGVVTYWRNASER